MVSFAGVIQETTADAGPQFVAPKRSGGGTPDPASSLRGFWSLIVTQFQGAFSDNILKWLVVFMILGMNVSSAELHRVGELVTALFSLPFILFSMAGGFFADRFSKRTISVSVKIFEMGVMLLALAGFWWNQIHMLLGCVFLMGVHSSFFGPSKYGLLPELLPERKLSWGNGLLELGTFMAIILGTVAAARMSETISRTPGLVRNHFDCARGHRLLHEPGHHPRARRRSRREIPREFSGGFVRATAARSPRPGTHSRRFSAIRISFSSASCCC